MNLTTIGIIKSPVTEGVDENWGEVIAEIQLDERLAAGLQGLEEFSHILVIFICTSHNLTPASIRCAAKRSREETTRWAF